MSDVTSGASPPSGGGGEEEGKCPHCKRKKHDTGKYPRSKSERKKALLRDANDPNSGLSEAAKKFILKRDGDLVPRGYEVSHEEPLYTKPKSERCKIDKASNLKTQMRSKHRRRHRSCGEQYHLYPR